MKKVLWISRHEMTAAQRADLDRIMGEEVSLLQEKGTIADVRTLLPEVQASDAVAAVLPMEQLAGLLDICGDTPLMFARSARVPTGREIVLTDGRREQEFAFVHQGWEQILGISVRTRSL